MNFEDTILNFFDNLNNINFNSILSFASTLYVVFWLVVVVWVWIDSGERTDKVYLRVLASLVVLVFNLPGLLVYLVLRPRMTTGEQYWADLEKRYLLYETAELNDCEQCGAMLQPGFVYCPSCKTEIKVKCKGCGVNVDKSYMHCPFCGVQNDKFVPKAVERKIRYETFAEFATRKLNEAREKKVQKMESQKPLEASTDEPVTKPRATTTRRKTTKRRKPQRRKK